jgi:hypothetical protein
MAALGSVVSLDRLTESDESPREIVEALEIARQHGLIDETRQGYRFRYHLIHEILALNLGRHERRVWGSEPDATTA